jgi:hypothetical protein
MIALLVFTYGTQLLLKVKQTLQYSTNFTDKIMTGSPNRSIEWRLKLFSVQSAIAELLLDLHAVGKETEICLRYYFHLRHFSFHLYYLCNLRPGCTYSSSLNIEQNLKAIAKILVVTRSPKIWGIFCCDNKNTEAYECRHQSNGQQQQPCWNFKQSVRARNRVGIGLVVVPARQATQPGGIGSLKSILGFP